MSYQDSDHGLPPTYQLATSVPYDNQKGPYILPNGQYMQTNPNANTTYSEPAYVNPNQRTVVYQPAIVYDPIGTRRIRRERMLSVFILFFLILFFNVIFFSSFY
jgi:hypothetical protein